ncbi:MAG: peptide-methionine (S)-S-oxide reductase MsrA [Nitrospirae bacterium]|nr:peptide-methionine (S)-S-oxide reductase MsrA [Nitrospirota bacterium]
MDQSCVIEIATLAGGCFWCLEAVFKELKGVVNVVSGYTGGLVENPTYREVCTGTTGHAEAVQITFDSKRLSYEEILKVFFSVHDPTTLNRQGPDKGAQYRSAVFYHTPEQKETAEKVIRVMEEEKLWDGPVVTEVRPFNVFYAAEDCHRDYFGLHNEEPYCRLIIAPKLAKFRVDHFDKLKK